MAWRFFVVVLLLCGVIPCGYTTSGNIQVEIHPQKATLRQGKSIKIKCRISGNISFDVRVRWQKKQDEEWISIGDDDNANEQFRLTGRYVLSLGDGDEDIFFSLKIANITTADTGVYRCLTEGIARTSDVTVLGPINGVTFTRNITIVNHSPKEKSDIIQVQCVVNASSAAADVSIFKGNENITNRFKRSEEQFKTGLQGLRQKLFLMRLNGTLKSSDFIHLNDRQLTCQAKAEGYSTIVKPMYFPQYSPWKQSREKVQHKATMPPSNAGQSQLRLGNGRLRYSFLVSCVLLTCCRGKSFV